MKIVKSKRFLFAAALLASLGGAAFAESNLNTTIQEGRVNANATYQQGRRNDNATYQQGRDNANRTWQQGRDNWNQTGQFGRLNYNETRQRVAVEGVRPTPRRAAD